MVKLCVVFSGLAQDLVQQAWPEQSNALHSCAWDSELSLDYEHALTLLLNAADVQMSVHGLFLIDKNSSFLFDESLMKKLKQLDLFEVPCSACTVNDESSADLPKLLHKLPFINHIAYKDFNNIVSQSEHVIWI